MRDSGKKAFIVKAILGVIVVGVVIIGLVSYIKYFANKSGKELPYSSSDTAKQEGIRIPFKLKCEEDRNLHKKLQLKSTEVADNHNQDIIPNKNNTFFLTENIKNEDGGTRERTLVSDINGHVIDVIDNTFGEIYLDENGYAIIKSKFIDIARAEDEKEIKKIIVIGKDKGATEEQIKEKVSEYQDKKSKEYANKDMEKQIAYITNSNFKKLTEDYDNIERFGKFYKAEKTTFDKYGPLFIETTIFNKNLKPIYKYNNNKEKPVRVKLACQNQAIEVEELSGKSYINASGIKTTLPANTVNVRQGYDCVYYTTSTMVGKGDKKTEVKKITVKSIDSENSFEIPLSNEGVRDVEAFSYNLVKYEYDKGKIEYKCSGVTMNTENITEIEKVISTSPHTVFIAEIKQPDDIITVSKYYGVFSTAGATVSQLGPNYIDILDDEGLYYPYDNIFYARERRENTEGGFYHIIDKNGKTIINSEKMIVDITSEGLKIKLEDDGDFSQQSIDDDIYFFDTKTGALISKTDLQKRIIRDVAAFENKEIPFVRPDIEKKKQLEEKAKEQKKDKTEEVDDMTLKKFM